MYTCGFALWISQLINKHLFLWIVLKPSTEQSNSYAFGHNVQVIHRHYNIVTSYANTYNVYNSIEPKICNLGIPRFSKRTPPPTTSSFCCYFGKSIPTFKSLLLKTVFDQHLSKNQFSTSENFINSKGKTFFFLKGILLTIITCKLSNKL